VSRSFERLSPYVGKALGLSEDALAQAYRPARESEIPQVLDLRRSVDHEMWWDDASFVRWRYFSRRTESGESTYWVFVRDGELLGACGMEPVTLVVDGAAMPAVRTLDIMVRPDLDGLGLGVFMNLVLFRHFPITLVTGSNTRSHALLTRMFHHTTDLRFWKAPLRARAVIDGKVKLGPMNRVVARPADLLLTIRRSLSRVSPPAGISIREMAEFDTRVVDLSQRCELAGRVMVRRSDEYLNWRFVRNPRCQYRIFGAFAGDRLEGYLMTRLNLARPNPRREAEIVDWLAAPVSDPATSVLPVLVQAGVDGLVDDGAGIVTCAAAAPDLSTAMEATGFRFRSAERLPFFVRAADSALHARLCSGGDWFLTRGDLDVE